jgi:hypothetical protein
MLRKMVYINDSIQRLAVRQVWLDIRKFSKQFTNIQEYKDIMDISAPCVRGLGAIDKRTRIERCLEEKK